MENQNIKYKDVPLIKEIEKCNDNILYYGEGGIGKTTQMQLAFNYFSSKCTNTVPIFLDADKEIDFRKADPLMSAIAGKYLGSDIETDDIWKLFTNNSSSSAKNYTYIIFIDGINELTQNNKDCLIEKITHIIDESKNTRFIISSRIKENLGLRFKNIAIKPLEKKNILKYLGENYGVNDNSKNINDSLVEILQIPLYLSVFKNTYNSNDYNPNIYDESTVRKADILNSYIQKILHEKRETNAADTALFEFIVKYFLPALAFEMVKENVHVISIMDFRKLRDNTKYFEAFCYDDNALDIFERNSRKAHNYIVENFALLESHNDVYTFPHQIWRDYFCAKHIINCLNVTYSEQIQNDLEIPVDNEIRGFVGQLIYTYDEKFHYSKDEHFPPEKPDRMCECDFEAKDNLEEWDESPIEHYMQQHNLEQEEQNQISPLVTRNLIEIMKNSRNNHITSNYNHLDFKSSNFSFCDLHNSTMINSKIYDACFLKLSIYGEISSLIFKDKNTIYFSIINNSNTEIYELNLRTNFIKEITKIEQTSNEIYTPTISPNGRFIAFEKGFEIFFYDLFHKKIIGESLNIMYFEEINTDESLIPTIPIPYFPTKFYGNIHFFNKDCHIILFFRECYDEIADTFGKVKIEKYNILTGATEELDINEPGNIISCAISQNDELIAFCYKDGKILIWNNFQKKITNLITKINTTIKDITFIANENIILCHDIDDHISTINLDNNKLSKYKKTHFNLMLSHNKKTVIMFDDYFIKLKSVEDLKKCTTLFESGANKKAYMDIVNDSKFIVINNKILKMYDLDSGTLVKTIEFDFTNEIKNIYFIHGNVYLLVLYANMTMELFDVEKGIKIENSYFHNLGTVNHIFSSTNRLAIMDINGNLNLTSVVQNNIYCSTIPGFDQSKLKLVDFASCESEDISCFISDKIIFLKFFKSGIVNYMPFTLETTSIIRLSPYGKYIALGSVNGEIKLYYASNFKHIGTLKSHSNKISFIEFSKNEKKLISYSANENNMNKKIAISDIYDFAFEIDLPLPKKYLNPLIYEGINIDKLIPHNQEVLSIKFTNNKLIILENDSVLVLNLNNKSYFEINDIQINVSNMKFHNTCGELTKDMQNLLLQNGAIGEQNIQPNKFDFDPEI